MSLGSCHPVLSCFTRPSQLRVALSGRPQQQVAYRYLLADS